MIGLLGILKAGGAYLPIDPVLPFERIRSMLKDSGASVLLRHQGVDTYGFQGRILEFETAETGELLETNPGVIVMPDHLAYVMYTSGTTGRPKGVMIEHRSVVNFLFGMTARIAFEPTKPILFAATLSFDISVVETLLALTQGMRIIVATQDQQRDPQQLTELIKRHQIAMLQATPSRLHTLLAISSDYSWLESVSDIMVGGEALTEDLLNQLQTLSSAAIYNMFGPTETTVWSMLRDVSTEQTVAIGSPNANMRYYVVDPNGQLQPIGVAGELCIAGDGVGRGYINQPELTLEKYVDNPFEPGTKMYRTGDLGRWQPDGNLVYMGRMDHQVKIRGHRIECGEIEVRLKEHEHIRQAVVLSRNDEHGQAYLCAYLVYSLPLTVAEIHDHLSRYLPDYMIPSYFVEMENIPLNNNGKVDRKMLPAPDREAYTKAYEAPRDVLETQLVELFAGVLGVNEVGIGDSFFERGGHSLKAVTLVSRIHQQLAVELPLRELFARPTVKALAAYVRSADESDYGRIEPAVAQASYPLSSAQRRLYVLHEMEPESTRYNMPGVIELVGKVDADRLGQAIRSVIARHESLRTSFIWIDGEPRQQVHEDVTLDWECRDVEEDQAPEFTRRFVRPFVLNQAPLLRAELLRLAEDRYWLLWDMHHIVSDGMSMGILISDFLAAYAGKELAPLQIQYKDYAVWQQGTLEVERMQVQEAYWITAYAEEVPILELPTDRIRPAVPSSEGGQVHTQISAEVAEGLKRIATETGATLYMVLLSAYNVWLHKYTGQTDIVVGTPVSGRTHGDTEPMIGMFVNTLALRNAPSGDKPFIDFVREVKELTLAAFEHQDYPFEELVEKLNVRRDLSRNPLFDTMLVLQNMEETRFELVNVEVRPVELNHPTTKFDFTLNVVEREPGLQLTLEYSRALFNEETVERYLRHFVQLVSQMIAQPEASIGSYELVTSEEKQQLHAFNDTAADYPREATIHGLFEAQVEKTPDAVAVVYGDQQLTYAELNTRANQLAWRLREQGVGPDCIVAIMAERSLELMVGLYGILKAGGAYLPIDPSLPAERIRYILEDSGAAELLVQTDLDPCGFEGTVIELSLGEEVPLEVNPPLNLDSGHLAYVIYTSGTTGNPKGVMIEHRSVINRLKWMQHRYPIGEQDVLLQKTPITFDVSVWELFWWGMTGARVSMLAPQGEKDPAVLAETIERHGVTVMHFVPSMLSVFLEQAGKMFNQEKLSSLHRVFASGEALKPQQVTGFYKLLEGSETTLHNLYGPTEATVDVTYYESISTFAEATVPIGKPIANTQLYIVDDQGQLQPMGVAGELCIAGDGLARGYLNRPELTAEKFVDNPFEQGTRMYRTGDLARWLPNGNLEYLGRIDHQVKIRGYRIECGEIEAQLLTHAHIREAVVLAREDEQGQAYLCAYLVSDAAVSVEELRVHLAVQLPEYMIPSYVVEVENIPLNTSGKVDRETLPVPKALHPGSNYEVPSTPKQQQLAGIWQDMLGLEQVGIHDNFFVLGGDSIKAIRLVSRINRDLDASLPLKELYLHQTIKELAEILAQKHKPNRQLELGQEMLEQMKRRITDDPEQVKYLPAAYEDVYPLSKIQQSMVFYSRLRPEEPIYHDQFLYYFKIISTDRFTEALQWLSDKHPILRTTFDLTHFEEEVQIVHARIVPEILIEDISLLGQEEQEHVISAYIEQDQCNVFRFDGEVLWRVRLFRLNTQHDYCLVFTFHHAILDGWSVASFRQEAIDIYQQLLQKKTIDMKPLQSSYKNYVAINRYRESDEESQQYWINELAGYTRNKLPFNYAGKKRDRGAASKMYRRQLSSTLLEALKHQAKRYGCTVKELCLSAHMYLLGILTTEEEVVTGVVSHDRPALEDADKVLGCFLNTVPIRMGVSRRVSKSELVCRTKQQLAHMKANELFLVDIAHAIGEVSSPSVNPIFDTLFNYTDFHVLEEIQLEDGMVAETAAMSLEANEMTNTWFDLEVSQFLENLNVQIKYASAYFEDHEINTAFVWYERILGALCDEETDFLSMEHLMTEAERQEIVYEWNRTDMPYAVEKTLHQLFEEQAAKTPERPALRWNGQLLTYQELNERSNRLAWRLQARGVNVNDHVGLMTERGFEMIVGMLAILKAGAAYVPMDPNYPQSRIAHIISHADVRIVVVDREYAETSAQFIDSRDPSLIEHSSEVLQLAKDSHELAYIIYTSGSTGEPKGVMIEHHSAVNLISWVNQEFDVHEEDRLLFITSMCFDLSVYDIFGPLAVGAQIVIASQEQVQDLKQIQLLLEEEAITIWDSVPTTLNHVLHGIAEQNEAISQHTLRLALVSGDWIPVDLMERAKVYFPNVHVIGLGGATEATVWSNYYPIEEVLTDQTSIPYGKPLGNNTFYILDADRHPVPYGVAGELYIGGVGVARGYLNDPVKTRASFMANPFVPQGWMYRTGDMGRMLPDGNMEFLGRQDYQVKIRGYRVELGEIENQLLKHEAVREAVVINREDAAGGNYLSAYVVLQEETSSADIREHLRQALPGYMIPGYMIPIECLPLTPNGKLDRKALPEPVARVHSEERYEAASTETELKLLSIWQDVLNIENIGVWDDFFAIGGHSLRATTLVSKVQKKMNLELTLQEVFRLPTIKEQARKLEGMSKKTYSAIEPANPDEDYPLSSAQRRLYVLHEMEPESTRYNMPGVIELVGKVDAGRLEQAIHSVIARHESLRTSFIWIDGEPRQQVHEDVPLEWVYREVEEAEAREFSRRFVRPFVLDQAPLLRAELLRLAEDRYWLLWDMHHIVSDGVSMGILISDFLAAYAGKELAPLRIQYKDYAVWQQGTLEVERMQVQEAYWLSAYAEEVPVLELPTDRIRPAVPSSEGGQVYTQISAEVAEGLKRIATETGATLYMVLLAAYNVWLHKYTGQTDIVVGTPVSGRTHGDTEPMIGMFVNTLALRNAPSGNKRFIDFVREVKEQTLAAFEHPDYPFDELVEQLNVRRDLSRNPLFDTMLILQNMEQTRFELANVEVGSVELNHPTTKFDFTLNVVEREPGLQLTLEYSRDLFNEETVERYLRHFVQLVSQMIAQPEASIGSYELVTSEEKQQLHAFNDTAAEYPREATIHGLFEAQVEKTPDAVAVICGDKQLTYAELNARANQLSWILRDNGVQADTVVGIAAERSLDMIIGLLGILKAGGAYLPIDPVLPFERIRSMLKDSGASVLLRHQGVDTYGFQGRILEFEIAETGELLETNPGVIVMPDHLAYVMYTSGTTGRPKGVMIEHRSVVNFLFGMTARIAFEPTKPILFAATLSFDISVVETLLALTQGMRIIVATQDQQRDPQQLTELIKRHQIAMLQATPSRLHTLLAISSDYSWLESVSDIMVGGEALTEDLLNQLQTLSSAAIYNMFGPTETTVWSMLRDVSTEQTVTIGSPNANMRYYVVDPNGQLQPIGVAGELCIAGDGVGRGYINQPELTLEKYVDNPFEPGTKMYRTGDLGRWQPDGNLVYMGRMDHQVKIRGHRIECGEIEVRLKEHEHIRQAVVLSRNDEHGQAYLCAYLVYSLPLTVAEIHDHLSRYLPDYMIPSYFVEMENIPLNNNGKVDRKMLPAPDREAYTKAYEAPRDVLETQLVELFAGVLGVNEVGIGDSFFERGGHSLKAVTLVSRIHQQLAVELPLRELFARPTVKALADYVRSADESDYGRIEPAVAQASYPLSSAQRRLYVLHEMEPESTRYNMPGVIELVGKVDAGRLEQAIHSVIARHESLRTSFIWIDGEPRQQVHEDVPLEWVYREVEEAEAREFSRRFVRPFVLDQAPLLRAELLRLAEDRYWLLWDMHHIVSDGMSMGILISDFLAAYAGKELAPLQIQYKDYAVWQQGTLEVERMQVQEAYWLTAYAEEVPILELPTDRIRPAVPSSEGGQVHTQISAEVAEGLKRIATETGATLYMVLLAAYNVWLHKYTGQTDIVVGTPVSGRTHGDTEPMIGMFVNTLALRNAPSGNKRFIDFVREVKEQTLAAFEHPDYPFDELVEQLNVRRDLSRNPLFDTMLILQNMEQTHFELANVEVGSVELNQPTTKFDFTLNVVEREPGLQLTLEYSRDLFNEETVERYLRHFVQLVSQMIAQPEASIGSYELVTSEEKQQLHAFNDTAAEYPREATIHGLFEAQVEKTPDAVAVICGDKQLTYAELNARANQLSWILRDNGVQADTVVGIAAERSLDMIIGLLGILKAGGAYLPIDPVLPFERIRSMLKDSGASVLLRHQGVDTYGFQGRILEFEIAETGELLETNPGVIVMPDHLAYVMYTSGTTGRPKGVMIEHRSVVNFLFGMTARIAFEPTKPILFAATLSFDISVVETLLALTQGMRIIVATQDQQRDPQQLTELIKRHQIAMLQATPSRLHTLLAISSDYSWLESVSDIMVGGEALTEDLLNQLQTLSSAAIYNMFGPTETTVWSMLRDVSTEQTVTIGSPNANMRYYVVDPNGQLQPIGVAGELCIAGDGVGRGYINQPELTLEKYVDNPFEPGTKMYRTGDLGRWQPDGNLVYMGRMDHQVKIRGHRIECGEIEVRLKEHEHIRQAVVLSRNDEHGQAYLCAYLVYSLPLTVAEIHDHLSRYLPDYMIPSYFVEMENIPLNNNGKVDRKMLPAPDREAYTKAYEAPRDVLETQLVELFAGVLGVNEVGIGDSFFERGGHSLKAVTLVSRIHQQLAVELPLRELFARPTVKALAAYVRSADESDYGRIEPAVAQASYPLSSAQRRLYVLHEMEPESTRYNMPGVIELVGKVDAGRLEQAIHSVIARHESLRTSFIWIDGEPRQQVHEDVPLEWVYREVEEAEAREFSRRFVRPFVLDQAPLLRAELLRLAEDRYWLLWDMHHIVSDGMSMGILISDFLAAYAGKELASLRIQYKDYAVWQQGTLEVERMQVQEAYWLSAYAEEVPVLELPTDRIRPAVPSSEGGQVHTQISAEVAEGLKRVATETGATLYMVLLAAYNVWLHKYTGQTDIVVGTPVSGRTHGDTEPMIGMFVNTLALRNAPSGDKPFMDFVREVKERTLAAFDHQDYPFEELVEKLDVRRDLSRNPLFDTMLVLQNMEETRFELVNVEVRPVELNHPTTKFDFTLNVVEREPGLQLMLEYSRALFNEATAKRYLRHFVQLVSQITAQPEARIGSYELVTLEEKQQLHGFNDTAADYPREATIHGLFEAQVEKTPDAVAVVYGDQQLTYAELNARANQLAWTLREQGVGAECIVAIMAERSLELMVGLYGILKAGGAYLPIDPSLPAERIRYMLRDSGAVVLLSDPGMDSCGFEGAVLDLAEAEKTPTQENLVLHATPSDMAYLIYTSGTTGNPKGVMIEHRSVVNFMTGMTGVIPFAPAKSMLLATTLSFDISVVETLLAFTEGMRVVIASEEQQKDPQQLARLIERQGIDMVQMTPSRLKMLLSAGCEAWLEGVTEVLVGGEAWPDDLLADLQNKSKAALFNMYGPTETTIWSAVREVTADQTVTIGGPIANTQLYIVDDQGQLQPMGVAGELCISGDGLARGYLNRPELTAEKFVDNPFEPGTRMYRTGDLARWLPDGNLEYLGRMDHQVKIRGYRIECGEIEAQLLAHAHIREAVVMGHEEEPGQAYLCAYLVCSMPLTVAQIHAHLSRYLPEYMIPSYFVEMENIPLNNNGKVDRKLLPVPELTMHDQEEKLPPITEIESEILKIWEAVLHKGDIGVMDNFFYVGGNSLRIIDVYTKLEQKYPGVFVLADLFGKPNVRQLARYVETIYAQKQTFNWKPLAFPTSGLVEQGDYIPGDVLRFELSEQMGQSLARVSSHYSVQKVSVLMTAFAYLMSEYAQTETVTLPCLLESKVLCQVEVSFQEVEELEEVFEIVDGYLKTEDRFDWDQVKYTAYEQQEAQILCAFVDAVPLPAGFAKQFDLVLNCGGDGRILSMTCEYNRSRILQASVERLIRQFVSLLEKILEQCEKKAGLLKV
ncbi:non-ribosomal peptide synthase/polyketide synthase [Paenibacillus amylolyticus]